MWLKNDKKDADKIVNRYILYIVDFQSTINIYASYFHLVLVGMKIQIIQMKMKRKSNS